ncbi:hypothetical protein [Burkholderia vietnamiensis]|uniref:hypothetical protein n=1 Tax=Burkholderia vietnamiensis TaxID=60552 RepID=UPI001CC45691|nr:hypothetical protein [Burkholderia vietnamiensis]
MIQMLIDFNKSESAIKIDFSQLCGVAHPPASSAIDTFYTIRELALTSAYQEPFASNETLRSNLLLLVFSSAETYFRRIIAESMALCPVAKESASQQQVSLGAFSTFTADDIGFAISDTRGFTSSGEIVTRTKTLLGISIKANSSLSAAVSDFERVCNFRHSIAHCSGELLYNNRRELNLSMHGRVIVSFDDKAFQDVLQVVVNCVRAFNNTIANEILQRWFVQKIFKGQWSSDKKMFERHHGIFRSSTDNPEPPDYEQLYKTCKQQMKVT